MTKETKLGALLPVKIAVRKGAFRIALLSVLAAGLLSGCGKKTNDQAGDGTGQVIAHVGADDVTLQELDNELRLANIPVDKRDELSIRKALGEIIVRKYLVQLAMTAKLDREPTVHLDLLRSREQVLAGALVQRGVAEKSGSIGKTEIDRYIGAHPGQFAKRELFTTEQISFALTSNLQSIVDAAKDFTSLDQVDQKLSEMGVLHNRSTGTLDSENIPNEFFAAIEAKKATDVFFLRTGLNGLFVKITGKESKPLAGEDAANRARQLLRIQAFKDESFEMSRSAEASAKYEGNYAKIMSSEPPKADNQPNKN